ncbi:MAG: type II toxin-antitoxin system VapC family toxin [Betaproteobacteria bacterium]|nr:type II toxin-antitoxin system VapC family toxin [Betaproteobacteria bacterium]
MTSRFVLDANVPLTWFLDEEPEQAAYAQAVARIIQEGNPVCVVPAIWHVEVATVLLAAHRDSRRRFSSAKLGAALEVLHGFSLETHHFPHEPRQIVMLARQYHLQTADALHFDLARTQRLPIATFDRGIRDACRQFDVDLLKP